MLSTTTDIPVTENPVIEPPSTARRKALSDEREQALVTFELAMVDADMPIIEPSSEVNTPSTDTAATLQSYIKSKTMKRRGVTRAIVFICLLRYALAPVEIYPATSAIASVTFGSFFIEYKSPKATAIAINPIIQETKNIKWLLLSVLPKFYYIGSAVSVFRLRNMRS
jgi:hypothetical protein